jgi:TrmH family RNA methyltransferase
LLKNSFRKKSQLFFVEGEKECQRGLQSDFRLEELIVCPDIIQPGFLVELRKNLPPDCAEFHVSPTVYARLAYRGESEGVIGIFRKKETELPMLLPISGRNNLYIVVENIEKPGNLGALMRTADAVGARAVILTGAGTDLYHPNVIRSSLGTNFTVPVVHVSNEAFARWAAHHQIPVYCAALPAYHDFYSLSFDRTVAFVFGSEHSGLSDFWLSEPVRNFTLPMHGIADSLNLSVSAAVVAYEYLRRFSKP